MFVGNHHVCLCLWPFQLFDFTPLSTSKVKATSCRKVSFPLSSHSLIDKHLIQFLGCSGVFYMPVNTIYTANFKGRWPPA